MDRASPATLTSTLPARLDRLPWSRWHWRVVSALGITWILDGLEVTVVGSLGPTLQQDGTLGLSAAEVGWAGSAYVAGAVLGALYFGRLADKIGRKPLFLVTLSVYLVATLLTAGTWSFWSFAFCRFLTGFGIGGEYAAINSAIDELIPARVRGLVDLAINGSFWLGAAAGAGLSIVLLEPGRLPEDAGWRVAFAFGAVLTVAILLVRRHLPESPRWLMTRGRLAEAEAVVARIEAEVEREHGPSAECRTAFAIRLREHVSWREIFTLLVTRYRRRAVLGFVLMGSQAFFYNAIF
ncbi:MAG TPA: MFS transporter, partial [Gammaproteobacteria bacterium]